MSNSKHLKIILLLFIAAGIISTIITAIIQKTKKTNPNPDTDPDSATTITLSPTSGTAFPLNSTCLTRSCVLVPTRSSDQLTVFWSFDSNTLDAFNRINAIAINEPLYFSGYSGESQCILFNGIDQYARAPFIPLFNRSFTIQFLVFLNIFPSDATFALLSQCSTIAPPTHRCLVLAIDRSRVLFSFFGDDQIGSTLLTYNQWYQLSFVFDADSFRRRVYVNGELDSERVLAHQYLGTSGDTIIGHTLATSGEVRTSMTFPGYMDSVSIYQNRAKSSCEIMNDATLMSYVSFDGGSVSDMGPNRIPTWLIGRSRIVAGSKNEALEFTTRGSYLGIGAYQILGFQDQSFAVTLWIYPYQYDGTIIHLTMYSDGSAHCLSILQLSSRGSPIARLYTTTLDINILRANNLSVPLNQWTHLALTFSPLNGLRLFVNGKLYGQGTDRTFYASGYPMFFLVGNFGDGQSCQYRFGIQSQFFGRVDEIRVFSRDLTDDDLCALASR